MLTLRSIIGFGASSVQGAVDPAGGGFIGRLAAWAAANSPATAVVNLGKGGNTTFDMLARIDRDVAAARPDLVIFSPGINDVPRGDGRPRTPVPDYTANMGRILDGLLAIAPTLFVVPFLPDCPKLGMDRSTLDSYMNAARGLARERGVPLVDLGKLIGADELPRLWHTDGLHFNADGHERIFGLVRDYVLRNHSDSQGGSQR